MAEQAAAAAGTCVRGWLLQWVPELDEAEVLLPLQGLHDVKTNRGDELEFANMIAGMLMQDSSATASHCLLTADVRAAAWGPHKATTYVASRLWVMEHV